jgi:hypothetical protein
MMTSRHHLLATMSLVIIFLTFLTLPLAAQGTCSTPLPHPPHQGGGKSASAIYGLQAVISKGAPVLGCQSKWDSYTNEWIMVVGPGSNAWIQLGWERSYSDPRVHIWYQARGPHFQRDRHYDPTDPRYRVDIGRTYVIEAMSDEGGITYWSLWADGVALDSIPATDLQWPAGSAYAIDAQWSGELSYIESEMGGPYSSPVGFYYLAWYLGDPNGDWPYIDNPRVFNSEVPKYGGDAFQIYSGIWGFRNWTWSNFLFLPLILKDH